MNKKTLEAVILILFAGFAYYLYKHAVNSPSYNGLPTVSCINPTEPIKSEFSFRLKITVRGNNYPLEKTIGHDPGQCLRSIYTTDNSGNVFVKSNTKQVYRLKDFFSVWHRVFNKTQLFGNRINRQNQIQLKVNNKLVNTLENTPLLPNENISMSYR